MEATKYTADEAGLVHLYDVEAAAKYMLDGISAEAGEPPARKYCSLIAPQKVVFELVGGPDKDGCIAPVDLCFEYPFYRGTTHLPDPGDLVLLPEFEGYVEVTSRDIDYRTGVIFVRGEIVP